jgi:adenylylsulfate kinase-like enzyme
MHLGNIIWIFGMSGSGKTTLGSLLSTELSYLFLDADIVRRVQNVRQNFSTTGRYSFHEFLRTHARDLQWRGNNMVVASITPYQEMRNFNKVMLDNYYEVYLECDLDILKQRDPRGLYAKAIKGEIPNFTGVSDRFDEPHTDIIGEGSMPCLTLNTGILPEDECYYQLRNHIKQVLLKDDQ